jgi:hypothetical protein
VKLPIYLKINGRTKAVEIRKNPTYLSGSEIMVKVVLDVPDVLFNRPIPTATIEVPEDLISNPDALVTTRIISMDAAKALGLDVQEVTDGLVEMMKAKLEREAK